MRFPPIYNVEEREDVLNELRLISENVADVYAVRQAFINRYRAGVPSLLSRHAQAEWEGAVKYFMYVLEYYISTADGTEGLYVDFELAESILLEALED